MKERRTWWVRNERVSGRVGGRWGFLGWGARGYFGWWDGGIVSSRLLEKTLFFERATRVDEISRRGRVEYQSDQSQGRNIESFIARGRVLWLLPAFLPFLPSSQLLQNSN